MQRLTTQQLIQLWWPLPHREFPLKSFLVLPAQQSWSLIMIHCPEFIAILHFTTQPIPLIHTNLQARWNYKNPGKEKKGKTVFPLFPELLPGCPHWCIHKWLSHSLPTVHLLGPWKKRSEAYLNMKIRESVFEQEMYQNPHSRMTYLVKTQCSTQKMSTSHFLLHLHISLSLCHPKSNWSNPLWTINTAWEEGEIF